MCRFVIGLLHFELALALGDLVLQFGNLFGSLPLLILEIAILRHQRVHILFVGIDNDFRVFQLGYLLEQPGAFFALFVQQDIRRRLGYQETPFDPAASAVGRGGCFRRPEPR